jgi:hypothetical protein
MVAARRGTLMPKPRAYILLFFLCSSCAINALRVERASKVAVASDAVVEQARQSLEEVKARRAEANLSLVASDPSCFPARKIWIRLTPASGPLCALDNSPEPGVQKVPIVLDPVDERSLEPTILLISALADYGDALGKIATEPKPDVSKELKDVIEKAGKAQAIANGLLQLDLPDPAKLLSDEQMSAATNLIQFASELLHEADQAKRIRQIAVEQGPKIDKLSVELSAKLHAWLDKSAMSDTQVLQNNLLAVYKAEVVDKGARTTWDYDRRSKFLGLIAAARGDRDAITARERAFDDSLAELSKAREGLSRALSGNLTDADRRELRDENERRILKALGLLAKVVMAFSTGL